jgi:hypothetical protein
LLKEVEDPAYYAVHHLCVPCFMLQHNEYSREGWLAARDLLSQFVNDGLTPAGARTKYRRQVDSGQRKWSVTRGAKLAQVEAVVWTRTIADLRLDTAEHYCADVQDWARRVLADTEEMMRSLAGAPSPLDGGPSRRRR